MPTKTKNSILVIIVLIVALTIPALIFGKWIEAIIFFVCHTLIRQQFPKEYHHIVPEICRLLTGVIMFFGVCLVLPVEYSLLSAIPINYFIGWVGYVKRENNDLEVANSRLQEKLDNLVKEVNIYDLNELELRNFGASKGLSELQIDILVLRTIYHYRIVDICKERNYGRTTIKYHIKQIEQKLKN